VNEALVFMYILAYITSKVTKSTTFTRAIPAVKTTNMFISKIIIREKKISYLLLSRLDPDLKGDNIHNLKITNQLFDLINTQTVLNS
jgi:hypothetical protein